MIIGVDVSKATLDLCVLTEKGTENYQINNNVKSVTSFFNKIMGQHESIAITVCMESTGYYNWPCYEVFEKINIELFIVSPLHLKRSMGLARGKNDKIDAVRIAKFILLHKLELKPTLLPRKKIRVLQTLLAQRNRLIKMKTKLSVPTNELAFIGDRELLGKIQQSSQKVIKELEKQIKEIELALNELTLNDSELKEKYDFMTSIQGVGKVLAWTMLIKTNEFRSINDPRKLACYAGVVPFDCQSGSSIHKKPRVSFMADKTLKKLLHMAAMRAIQMKGDLQNYFLRKVAEGKNKMSVLNAIRNKLVARICAVINNKRFYQNDLLLS